MTKKISTYEDLLEEKQRLQSLLILQKQTVSNDWIGIRTEFKPAFKAVSFLGKALIPDRSNPLLNLGMNFVVDLVVKNFILARTGWIARTILPLLIKNYSSHLIDDYAIEIKEKIVSFFFPRKEKDNEPVAANNYKEAVI